MAIRSNLKTQIDNIATKVNYAEKIAGKQVKQVLKSTEKFRAQQLKNVHALLKRAEKLRATPIAKRAERVKEQIETGASVGLEYLRSKLSLPSQGEIERLNKKVASLQKRIEQLEKPSRTSN